MVLLLEDGIERVPVKSKDSQKLGGAVSRFGGTTAVLKDLDRLEKQPGKNNSVFARRQFTRTDGLLYSLTKIFNLGCIG